MIRRRWRLLLALVLGPLLLAQPVQAAGGTWGAGKYQYADGVVCTAGDITSPLAAWQFGDGSPDFLTRAVTSDGTTDSALLPEASAAGRGVAPVGPGELGFTSQQDIAAFAALLSRYGAGNGATVARAVLDRTDPGQAPSCVDPSSAAALLDQAAAAAGPYQLTLTPSARKILPGTTSSVTVRVTRVGGGPAAGVDVALSADQAVFAGQAAITVTTGSDGTATSSYVVNDGSRPGVGFQARASVSTGLQAVSAGAGYVGAVFAASPQTFTAHSTVSLDQSADPHITVASSSRAGVENAPIRLSIDVTGMRGHGGQASVDVTGPAPLRGSGLCTDVAASAPTSLAFSSPTLDVRGDGPVDAGSWTPDRPGCYSIVARITTTDAVPEATARSARTTVTVLDTVSSFTARQDVIGPGSFRGRITLDRAHSLSGTATLSVRGPATPASGDCAGVDWSSQPTRQVATATVDGDHGYGVTTDELTTPGCYQVSGTVSLALPGGTQAQVPVAVAGGRIVYVLQPALAITADRTWAETPGAVPTHVVVSGTYGQRGSVRIAMLRAPVGPDGCAGVSFAGAQPTALGPAARFSGDGAVAVESGATPQSGCYALVPQLSMTADPAVTAVGHADADAVIVAGVPVTAIDGDPPVAAPLGKPSALLVWPAVAAYLAIALGIIVGAVSIAAGARRAVRRPLPGIGLWD